MKIEQLKVLDAVVKAGSFAQAAQHILLISQPAVSTAIRKLEEDLGFLLFSRENYRPELTSEGKAFYRKAQELLVQSAELEAFGAHLAQGTEPHIKIAIDTYSILPKIAQILKQQTQKFPQTYFELSNGVIGSALPKLIEGSVDLVILPWIDHYAQFHQFETLTLSRSATYYVAAKGYPLLEKARCSHDDLENQIQIVERSNDAFLGKNSFGLFPQAQHWIVHDLHTKKLLIQEGIGFGMLPQYIIKEELKRGELLPFKGLPGYREHHIDVKVAVRKNQPRGPVLESLWSAFKEKSLLLY